MRNLLLVLAVLAACSGADLPPRNLVCERIEVLKAEKRIPADTSCVAEMSDVGEPHTHTARVTTDVNDGKTTMKTTVVCGLAAGQLGMLCSGLQVEGKPSADGAQR